MKATLDKVAKIGTKNKAAHKTGLQHLVEPGSLTSVFLCAALIFISVCCDPVFADTASWYSHESCIKEGTSGIMANNKGVIDDEKFTAASWFYPFGTRLEVSSVDTGRSVVCVVTDRGPAKRLVKKGRVIDLSMAAFAKLAPLSKGVIEVKIQKL